MKAKVKATGEIIDVKCLKSIIYSRLDCNGKIFEEYYEDELEFEKKKTKFYIVARPVDDMKQFLPVYITTHKKKAQTFWHYYTDESIALVIFSKEWSPEDNNLFFGYFDEYTEEDEYMCKQNTLLGMFDKIFDSEDRYLYVSGDPNEEKYENGMMNPKIYELK